MRASGGIASLLLLALAGLASAQEAEPAREGTRLFEALEASALAVVGEVSERRALDRHGWRATLTVESALVGEASAGMRIPIAWEELSSARRPRFASGDRVLVVLEPLASGSLWRERFPDVAEYVQVRQVAQRGLGFLRSPSLTSLQHLGHYLALPAGERAGTGGQGRLLALVADGERALAVSAANRLAERRESASFEAGRAALALRALARADEEAELSAPLLEWVFVSQPQGLAAPLDAALAETAAPPAPWVVARGLLPGGLAEERLAVLLADASPARRAAAVRVAEPTQRGKLASLARSDPAPEVRGAALRRLVELAGEAELEAVLDAFSDREASVRSEAAQLAAGLGDAAVPRLREAALGWPDPAPETAVLALRISRAPAALPVLEELAETHPDARLRALAALAIGRPLGHAD